MNNKDVLILELITLLNSGQLTSDFKIEKNYDGSYSNRVGYLKIKNLKCLKPNVTVHIAIDTKNNYHAVCDLYLKQPFRRKVLISSGLFDFEHSETFKLALTRGFNSRLKQLNDLQLEKAREMREKELNKFFKKQN